MAVELNIPGTELGEINVEKAAPNVFTSRKANPWLIALGVVLVICFGAGTVYARSAGSETVEKAGAGSGDKASKTTTTKNAPSETLLTTLLGTGAALIIVGALYGRISTIKLPGGVEVSMSKEAEEKTIKKSVEKHPNEPDKAAAVAQKAQTLLLQEAEEGSTTPTDGDIDAAVDLASAAT